MAVEIERKFLVDPQQPKPALRDHGVRIEQGYLSDKPCVRIRLISNFAAKLTIKGPGSIERSEFEYEIPYEDGVSLMRLAKTRLTKMRFKCPWEGHTWEVDYFDGPLSGLVLAELELTSQDEEFFHPPWLLEEVTHDPQYANVNLARKYTDALSTATLVAVGEG